MCAVENPVAVGRLTQEEERTLAGSKSQRKWRTGLPLLPWKGGWSSRHDREAAR